MEDEILVNVIKKRDSAFSYTINTTCRVTSFEESLKVLDALRQLQTLILNNIDKELDNFINNDSAPSYIKDLILKREQNNKMIGIIKKIAEKSDDLQKSQFIKDMENLLSGR